MGGLSKNSLFGITIVTGVGVTKVEFYIIISYSRKIKHTFFEESFEFWTIFTLILITGWVDLKMSKMTTPGGGTILYLVRYFLL